MLKVLLTTTIVNLERPSYLQIHSALLKMLVH
jgi:hypothetical protein